MINEIDLDIISELRRDGRRSCAGIAKGVGISESAARQRIRNLERSGAVRVFAWLIRIGLEWRAGPGSEFGVPETSLSWQAGSPTLRSLPRRSHCWLLRCRH
ncbi:winged helix-turn-helix transcriptional regulator [Mycolicibacterium wolinskyi]|uniref:winged helix-turn-helix transcriptional regulator n=1 Tax=Mycolicibacterium wolinskyi TaxID=59750 RepID=UPI00391775D1